MNYYVKYNVNPQITVEPLVKRMRLWMTTAENNYALNKECAPNIPR